LTRILEILREMYDDTVSTSQAMAKNSVRKELKRKASEEEASG
jgi:hypothetical protein